MFQNSTAKVIKKSSCEIEKVNIKSHLSFDLTHDFDIKKKLKINHFLRFWGSKAGKCLARGYIKQQPQQKINSCFSS